MELDPNATHCPISRCVLEPGYCEEHVSSGGIALLTLVVFVPIAIAILMPGVARSGAPRRH